MPPIRESLNSKDIHELKLRFNKISYLMKLAVNGESYVKAMEESAKNPSNNSVFRTATNESLDFLKNAKEIANSLLDLTSNKKLVRSVKKLIELEREYLLYVIELSNFTKLILDGYNVYDKWTRLSDQIRKIEAQTIKAHGETSEMMVSSFGFEWTDIIL